MDGYRLLGCAGFALAMTLGPYAQAAECPREDALGTSRIIAVDGAATRLADARSLRLGDREVVLTFDDDVIAGDWIPMTQQAQLKLLTDRLKAAGKEHHPAA